MIPMPPGGSFPPDDDEFYDASSWDTIELAIEAVSQAIEADRAAQILLHTAAAARMRQQIVALERRMEVETDPFTANNLRKFINDLSRRAKRHEAAIRGLRRATGKPKRSQY